ncbi:hypothetical protein IAI53_11955 [Thauera sp. CAU 1555]|uniref:RelA/SpoT domain-containing protein n=1 Tax=Thauera sedimentorum TaxID=2767595 RepID=A0ABR9BCB9_9RHOO|nr:hypothetical protein [Thauera sedimentorum]MBC9072680.1 hypothetical protein [Thauera sedimentorum]MBD8503599.1 hypothetical protein [Thauera sedimentorum]
MPDDQYVALLVSSEGDKAVGPIIEFMRRTGLTSGCYAYKFRVKSKEDLIHKKNRKTQEKPHYKLADITDVVGVRLVTLFKGEMLSTYSKLIDILASNPADTQLLHTTPEEIIVYRGTSAFDDLANEIQSITEAKFEAPNFVSKTSAEGYSSIHIICRHIKNINELNGSGYQYHLPIEIQIRTVFEDAWGEIDHKYGYVIREGKDAGSPINNSPHILSHLKVLKDFTDACMDYAECIRKEALPELLDLTTGTTKTISVASDEDILQRFLSMGIAEEFVQRYIEARSLRDEAADESGAIHDGRITAASKYLQAADLFSSLCNELTRGDFAISLDSGGKLAYYYCSMNEALCLMSTNLPEYMNAAIDKYSFIEAHYKNYPLAKMRLGQALCKAGRLEESIEKLRQAGSDFRELGAKSQEEGVWSDNLPRADYEHMAFTQPKILGFTLWKKSQRPGFVSVQEKADLYFEAYETTLKCLDAKEVDARRYFDVQNNLLYYCVGFAYCAPKDDVRLNEIRSKIPDLLDGMVTKGGGTDQMRIEDLDTVFKAYAFLEDPKAKEIARDLIQRCLRKDANLVTTLRISIAEVAQEYLDSGTIIAI